MPLRNCRFSYNRGVGTPPTSAKWGYDNQDPRRRHGNCHDKVQGVVRLETRARDQEWWFSPELINQSALSRQGAAGLSPATNYCVPRESSLGG